MGSSYAAVEGECGRAHHKAHVEGELAATALRAHINDGVGLHPKGIAGSGPVLLQPEPAAVGVQGPLPLAAPIDGEAEGIACIGRGDTQLVEQVRRDGEDTPQRARQLPLSAAIGLHSGSRMLLRCQLPCWWHDGRRRRGARCGVGNCRRRLSGLNHLQGQLWQVVAGACPQTDHLPGLKARVLPDSRPACLEGQAASRGAENELLGLPTGQHQLVDLAGAEAPAVHSRRRQVKPLGNTWCEWPLHAAMGQLICSVEAR